MEFYSPLGYTISGQVIKAKLFLGMFARDLCSKHCQGHLIRGQLVAINSHPHLKLFIPLYGGQSHI